MATIRIQTRVEGDTLVLPELKTLIGKTVEIVVTELPEGGLPADPWPAVAQAMKDLTDYDCNAWNEPRTLDLQHAEDHLP